MPSVLLGGLSVSDPAGSRAVRQAVMQGLPNHDILDVPAYPDLASLLGAARRSAGVLMAGARLRPFRRSDIGAAAISRVARRPLAFLGVSTGPVEGRLAAAVARWALGRADLLLLADEPSAAHLATAGVPTPMRVSADPAWLALAPTLTRAPHPAASHPARGESVAVVLDGRVPRAVEDALGAALATAARAGRPVRLIPWAGSGSPDGAMATRLVRAVGSEVAAAAVVEPSPVTLTDAASLVADAHAVVSLRYRGLHTAAAAGVPVIAISGDFRATALARRLRQSVVAPPDVASLLPITLERIGAEACPDQDVVGDEIQRARAGLRLMRLLFEPDVVGAADLDHLPMVPVPWL